MELRGEVRSARVSRKMDDNDREITVVDFRVKIPPGVRVPFKEIIELSGSNAIIGIDKAQIALDVGGDK